MPRKQNNTSKILGKKIAKKKMMLQETVQDCLDHGEPLSQPSIVRKNRKLSILLTERSKELSEDQDYPAKRKNLHFEINQILPVLQTMFPQETLFVFAETPAHEIQKFTTGMGSIIRARFLNNRHRLYRAFISFLYCFLKHSLWILPFQQWTSIHDQNSQTKFHSIS